MAQPQRDAPVDLCRHAVGTPLLAIRAATELLMVGEGGPLNRSGRELVSAIGEALRGLEHATDLLVRLACAPERHQVAPERLVAAELLQVTGLHAGEQAYGTSELAGTTILVAREPAEELLRLWGTLLGTIVTVGRLTDEAGTAALCLTSSADWPHRRQAGEGLLEERLLQRLALASGGLLLIGDHGKVSVRWPVSGV